MFFHGVVIYDNMYGLFTFTTEIAFKGKKKRLSRQSGQVHVGVA